MKKFLFIIFISLCTVIVGSSNKNVKKDINLKLNNKRFSNLELFNKVLYLVESQYYRKIDMEKLIEGAIKGMISTLDPHSSFLGEKILEQFKEDTKGEFGGLGLEVTIIDGVVTVISTIEDTPAFKSGIKSGDKIVEINNESVLGLGFEEVSLKLKGRPNTKVNIGVNRRGNVGILRFNLNREIITIKSVKPDIVDKRFAYIRIVQFQKNTYKSFIKVLKRLKNKAKKYGGIKGIVLDLRYNPGGYLEQAIDISSVFIKRGIIVSTEGRNPKEKKIYYVRPNTYKDLTTPLLVLINGASASASEIVAGALQDHKRAIIMGSTSFGKGSVQRIANIDKKRGVKLTIAQYMTPNNRKIQAIGINPDIYLNEFEGKWASEHKKDVFHIREVDLRNHLTATIETPDEKKLRLQRLKERRQEIIRNIKNNKQLVNKKHLFENYNASEDYQVLQAINYLKSFKLLKQIKI